MKFIIYILVLILLCSCNLFTDSSDRITKDWKDKEFIFPDNLQSKILGKDTACHELLEKPYKIVIHVDSTGCTGCRLNLNDWMQIINEYKEHENKLAFIFIVNTLNPKN